MPAPVLNSDSEHLQSWTKIIRCPTSSGASEGASERVSSASECCESLRARAGRLGDGVVDTDTKYVSRDGAASVVV